MSYLNEVQDELGDEFDDDEEIEKKVKDRVGVYGVVTSLHVKCEIILMT